MKFIQGYNRTQTHLFPVSLDQSIDPNNEVRLIDLFVESLPLIKFGFRMDFIENGRPAYHPGDLLKLFIYGYFNKIRSSRDLEKECKRNIEVMWLLKSLQPDHNTIANFRRDNPKAIKKVFRATVQIAKHYNLIGGKLIAGDSTKLRAQNSKKNNFNQAKIERHLAYIDHKLEEYTRTLAEQDGDDKEIVLQEIEKHNQRKEQYREIEDQLNKSGEAQVSTSDPESRQMIIRNNITEVAYNVQTTVDAKHCLLIDYKVTNHNDSKAMGNMVQRAKSILGTNDFTALYDKGYHTGTELKTAQDLGIKTIVAIPGIPSSSQAPNPVFNVEHFSYDNQTDTYTCPEGQTLKTNGNWYKKYNNRNSFVFIKQYKTPACKTCPVRNQCTRSRNGRMIERNRYTESYEINRNNVELYQLLYKRRQAIVEHPFGTIKRQWGFNYILTKKSITRASADVGFMFIAYNLRRIINIIGQKRLREYLNELLSSVFLPWRTIMLKIGLFCRVLKEWRNNLPTIKYLINLNIFPKYLPKFT
jgi:transposase